MAVMAVSWSLRALPAQASVAPGLPHADWATPGGGGATELRVAYNIALDPVAQPWQRPANVYWANQFHLSSSPSGGYLGLQTRSYPPAKVALFSWWNALDASCPSVPNLVACGPFDGEGVGYTAMVAFDWQPHTDYTFRLWRGDRDASRDAYWWNVEIQDGSGARLAPVGAILVPSASGGISGVGQWTEWFGNADDCDQIPAADAWFGRPVLDGTAATPIGVGVGYSAPCPAQAEWVDGGSRQRIGTSISSRPLTVQVARTMWWHPGTTTLEGSAAWMAIGNDPKAAAGQLAPAYLYAHAFSFTGGTAFGFVGLTTTPAGKHAVFTVVGPDGKSRDAVVPFDWKAGRFYVPMVHQLSPGVWGAWVFDQTGSVWVPIGTLNLSPSWGLVYPFTTSVAAWIGPNAQSCSAYPRADVYFNRPTGLNGGQALDPAFGGHSTGAGDCPPEISTVSGTWARFQMGSPALT